MRPAFLANPGCLFFCTVYLLYVDESGTFDKDLEYAVLGGIAIHVADIEHFRATVEAIIAQHVDGHNCSMELHANAMRSGSRQWRKVPHSVRHALFDAMVELIGAYRPPSGAAFSLFATARAPNAIPSADPLERSFEELLFRFRSMLDRLSTERSPQFGVVVADEAKHEKVVQPLVVRWRATGALRKRMGRLDRIVEVPLFVDSATTRLLQAADIVAHSVYRYYQSHDESLIGRLLPSFDADGGVMHGLVHLCEVGYPNCPCPACVSRMARDRLRLTALRHVAGRQDALPLDTVASSRSTT